MTDAARLSFRCLDPRGAKRATVAACLSGCGPVAWRRFGPLSLRSWPETGRVARAAAQAARRGPGRGLSGWLARTLYALQYNGARRWFARHRGTVAVVWNGLNGSRRAWIQGARDAGAPTLCFELSPFPGRVTVDPVGVNDASCLPRDIAFYRGWADARPDSAADGAWRAAGRGLAQRPPDSAPAAALDAPPLNAPFVFVPLQTPGDSQLRLFGGAFRTVEAFIDALGRAAPALPPGWHLRVKEHPTAGASFAARLAALRGARVVVDNHTDTFAQVAASRAVLTVNSSVGLQAMFHDRPVLAAGRCFWALDGVAEAVPDENAIRAALSRAETLTFDPRSREAFLTALATAYYVEPGDTAAIEARLGGADPTGFWTRLRRAEVAA